MPSAPRRHPSAVRVMAPAPKPRADAADDLQAPAEDLDLADCGRVRLISRLEVPARGPGQARAADPEAPADPQEEEKERQERTIVVTPPKRPRGCRNGHECVGQADFDYMVRRWREGAEGDAYCASCWREMARRGDSLQGDWETGPLAGEPFRWQWPKRPQKRQPQRREAYAAKQPADSKSEPSSRASSRSSSRHARDRPGEEVERPGGEEPGLRARGGFSPP